MVEFDGILPLWKPKGMTSHDCVFKVRKKLQMKKVGHAGTLDPSVSGVLPICLGKGTKLVDYLHEISKTYYGEITLGLATTTEDADGDIVKKKGVEVPLSTTEIDKCMQTFVGDLNQIPPMYSAVKVNGKRLYEYARAGEEVERPVRHVHIYDFARTDEPIYHKDMQTQSWHFSVTCSKGTYVRTLAVDLGKALGYPAHMSHLVRLSSGACTAGQAVTFEQLDQYIEDNQVEKVILSLEDVLKNEYRLNLTEVEFQKVKNGMAMNWNIPKDTNRIAVYYQDKVLALYKRVNSTLFKVERMLRNEL